MNTIINYFKDSVYEFKNYVEWTKWIDLQRSTIIVALSTLILSIFLFVVDLFFSNTIEVIYRNILIIFNPKN